MDETFIIDESFDGYVDEKLESREKAVAILKKISEELVEFLFPKCEYKFKDDYFPFTKPSYEIEVKFQNEDLEILGCGVIHQEILDNHKIKKQGIAFGLGLCRLAMKLFSIPDIRLLWSNDEKFLTQFSNNDIKTQFRPFSSLDSTYRDISFWIPNEDVKILENNKEKFTWLKKREFDELVRDICSDLIEESKIKSKYYSKKDNKYSCMYRLVISPLYDMKNPAELKKLADELILKIINNIKSNTNLNLILR
jgi:Phenylalanyl-tRNA synthetase alpha subunit